MKNAALIALALSAAGCPPRQYASCPPGSECAQGGVESTWRGLPKLQRAQTVREVTPVTGIVVTAAPVGAAGWRIQIANSTDAVMSILLDESTFVASTGEAGGRLISGSTKRMDTAKAQPPAPLAPHATYVGVVLIERMLGAERDEEEAWDTAKQVDESRMPNHKRNAFGAKLLEVVGRSRDDTAALVVGGKLYVTVMTADGKQTWAGEIVSTAKAPRATQATDGE